MHDIVNVFFNKHLLCENFPTLTNHFSYLLFWLTLRGSGDIEAKWRPNLPEYMKIN